MDSLALIYYIVIFVKSLEASCAFYDDLFGATVHAEYAASGQVLVRQLAIGQIVLSIHQVNNSLALLAKLPTVAVRISASVGEGA